MPQDIHALIKKLSPLMDDNSEIFRELAIFFGEGAKIATDTGDLSRFLGRKRLYRIIRIEGESYKDCVYQLVDNYPEAMESLGMLRYYKAPGKNIRWEDIEQAEIAIGKELTMNAYGWAPDAWTAFEQTSFTGDSTSNPNSEEKKHGLVAILAFDFGD